MITAIEMEAIIKTLAEKYEISNATKELTDAKTLAKHYVGELTPVIITGQRRGRENKLYAIIKTKQHITGTFEDLVTHIFTKEITAYAVLLPTFKALQEEVAIDDKFTFIDCYHYNSGPQNEILILQDMRQRGYNVYKGPLFLDLEHATLAIKEVAKFHALSFTLQHVQPEKFSKLSEHFAPIDETNYFEIFAEIVLGSVRRGIEMFSIENIKKIKSCFPAMAQESLRNTGTKRVICHTDLWRNNILFKYEDSKPISVCLLDYQHTQVVNPATDLLSFISACTDHALRQHSYERLLCVYHQTLADTLVYSSIDVAHVYTFEELKEDLKSVAPACLLKSIFGMQSWFGVGGIKNLPDVKVEDSGEVVDGTDPLNVVAQCKQAVEHLIADFVQYGYLQ